jgi:DNA invertase Pin-like site-specific DNA recombinase
MSETPRPAAIYARISEDRTGAGLGVERQIADCRALAARLGWPVVAVHTDNDVSAYSGKVRPGYRALLADLEAGRATGVLAWHTDRLHRSPVELERYISVCEAHGVMTQTVQAGHLDLATPSGRMVARMLGSSARFESEHKAERVRRARLQAAQAGVHHGGPRPFGYNGDDTIREDEASAVRAAAEAVLAGASLRSVAASLNAAGLVTSLRGNGWDKSSVRAMLLRPRNAGLRQHRGQVLGPAAWEPLLPQEQWEALVAILTDPARRTTPPEAPRLKYLGSGLYRCGGCGRPSLRVSTSGSQVRAAYRCSESGGTHVSRAQVPLDEFVQAVIVERLRRPDAAERLRPAAPDVDLGALRAEANAARARLTEIAEMLGDGELSRAEAQIARTRAQARLDRATAELDAATIPSPLAGIVDAPDPAAAWAGLDLGRKRAVLTELMTVTVEPARPGVNPLLFDPTTILVEWKGADG